MMTTSEWPPAASGQWVGALVGGSFGFTFVMINAGLQPQPVGLTLRVLGAVAFLAVLVAAHRGFAAERAASRRGDHAPDGRSFPMRGAFWAITAVEAVAIIGGVRILSAVLDAPQAGVAWVALVVGLHFFPLARLFRLAPVFVPLAVVLTILGAAGLVMAGLGVDAAPIALVSGVGSGLVLLAWACWGATRRPPRDVQEQRAGSGARAAGSQTS